MNVPINNFMIIPSVKVNCIDRDEDNNNKFKHKDFKKKKKSTPVPLLAVSS